MSGNERLGDARITEEMVADVQRRLGKGRPPKPWVQLASKDTIRHFALSSVGDDNPIYLDEEYAKKARWGTIIAPPMFPYASTTRSTSAGGMGFPGIFGLHAYDEWFFHRPVKLGDSVNAMVTPVSLEERPSRWGGRAFYQLTESRFTNQNGELISVYNMMGVRAERGKAREAKKYNYEPHCYSEAELAAIEADYDAEVRRGTTPRYWEDVQVGESIGHVTKGPMTVTDICCWWMGAGAPLLFAFGIRHKKLKEKPGLAIIDPDTNIAHTAEIAHFDEKYARRSGMGGPYDAGRQRTNWFLHLLTNWAGDDGFVRYIKANFLLPNYVGDTTWCRGRVSEKLVENGEHLVKVEMWADNQRGERHSTGSGTIELPSRG